MYNSKANPNRDENDDTIIDPNMVYRSGDRPVGGTVVSRMKKSKASGSIISSPKHDDSNDYVYIEHERSEVTENLLKILEHYRLDLEDKVKDQRDCDQNLIVRLTDYLRSIVASDATKLKDLENLYENISDLQDIRFIDQKEKIDQLNDEMIHLKKLIITPVNENPMSNVYQLNSMVNYQQWAEMEDESKKLYQLVERQREKINELAKLLVEKDQPSTRTQSNRNTTTTTTITTDQHRSTGKHPPVDPECIAPPKLSRHRSCNDPITCPICKCPFPKGTDEFELDEHIEQCTKKHSHSPPASTHYKCPICAQQLPTNDQIYLGHVTQCLNQQNDDH